LKIAKQFSKKLPQTSKKNNHLKCEKAGSPGRVSPPRMVTTWLNWTLILLDVSGCV
jgi:hypothetical protein